MLAGYRNVEWFIDFFLDPPKPSNTTFHFLAKFTPYCYTYPQTQKMQAYLGPKHSYLEKHFFFHINGIDSWERKNVKYKASISNKCMSVWRAEKWNEIRKRKKHRKIREKPRGDTTEPDVLEGEIIEIPRLVAWLILCLAWFLLMCMLCSFAWLQSLSEEYFQDFGIIWEPLIKCVQKKFNDYD